MIANLVENWLTNVNEKGYQVPFCQVLTARRFRVLHISAHGPGEAGKDIIARDGRNRVWAFQLKGGDITLSGWRAIREEVEELACLPVVYPGISERATHTPVLVTNGQIRGDARASMRAFSRRWERLGARPLQVWQGTELLSMFLEAQGSYLPTRLRDFRAFVELYVSDFQDVLPRAQFASFLESLTVSGDIRSARRARRAVEALVLTAGYIVSRYETAANHVAACQGWTVAAANILRVATEANLDDDVYMPSLNLVKTGLYQNLANLQIEVQERSDFIEPYNVVTEPLVYGARVAAVVGWLVAALFAELEDAERAWKTLIPVLRREFQHLRFTGEADWPALLSLCLLVERRGTTREVATLLGGWINAIIGCNSGVEPRGFPSPYWLPERTLSWLNGALPQSEKESFAGHSYTLFSALDMLVRRLYRQRVAQCWPEASRIHFCDFEPKHPVGWLQWNNQEGTLSLTDPPQPAKWSSWRKEVLAVDTSSLPKPLLRHREWLLPFVLTYPHRLNRRMSGVLDGLIGRRCAVA